MVSKPRKKANKPRKQDQLPLVEAVKLRIRQIRDPRLAITEIEREMAGGRLRSYRRDVATGKQEPESSDFWKSSFVHYSEERNPHVIIHTVQKDRWNLFFPHPEDEPPTHVYFVSQSDFDRIFRAAQESAGDTGAPQRRKPGKVPTHEWPLVVAAELIRRSKAGEREPTAAEMIRYCEHTFPDQFSPGLKEMQTLLRKLLFGQF